ncbi:MAG: isocitrate lyase/phosphoenolpyruvate mutase family protein, partial [Rhodococcus sp. (in: high G+C Gram-positive bacteria)]|uniref:isocitrate lyase/phosphoenolpyruvate mutase family protein n=1 Tax=Rhodococcus sp. TaxID=1831 RepID=UPI003BB07EED
FHPSSLELLDELGVADELHEVGLKAPVFQYRERSGAVLSEMDMSLLAAETKYPYRLQSEQNNLTLIIRNHLLTMPNVTLQYSSPVTRVEQGFEHVRIFLPDTDRDDPIRARWVIAADGAQSNIRKSLGISFEGRTYDERFLVISTTHEFRDDFQDLAYVSYISDPEEWGVLLRTPNHWRALFPVRDDETDEMALSPEAMEARLQRIAAQPDPYEVAHASIYKVNMRAAATFAVGNILLAGDAAHVNNPLGGMGMNSGIHDAWAAAEVIDAALTGTDATHAASLYSELRRDAALNHVQAQAQKNYDSMSEEDDDQREARAELLSAMDLDLLDKRDHLRASAMFTSLRITMGRIARELRAVPAATRPSGRRLSELLCYNTVLAPGAYDGVSVKALDASGFKAGYVSGAAVSAAALGQPDLGYLGLAEMAEQVRRMTAVSDMALIVDGDTGYGGVLQVGEAVTRLERAGAAAIQFEDQVAPKRCGHLTGRQVVPIEEMVAKIEIAAGRRQSALIIARTDALSVEGLDAALTRVRAYVGAGADLVFVEGAYSEELLRAIHGAVPGTPLMINVSEAGDHSALPHPRILRELGVALMIYPVAPILASTEAITAMYKQIRTTGTSGRSQQDWAQFTALTGQDAQLEQTAALAASASASASAQINTATSRSLV